MTKKPPDVSVLMPAYNPYSNYPDGLFETSISSLKHQTGTDIELVLVDDGSTDDIRPGLLGVEESGVVFRYIRHRENRGTAAALTTAAKAATGRYLIAQSVRSWYEAGSLAKFVEVLDNTPDVGFVYGCTQYSGASNRIHMPPPFRREDFFNSFASLFGYMYRREAIELGCAYFWYLKIDERTIDIADYDFVMQLIVDLEWKGLALRGVRALNYYYSGVGQMTNIVHQYQKQLDAVFAERWRGRQ